ncbi:APC family permease [Thiotrichales bacterium 19S9-12]|nr:APC family permease [Thiotrichales bacterium 19S9-11]MCF6812391.1 APC family permease [Thiotrichales bacterium 19S9-12]
MSKRSVTFFGLLFSSISAILGSGWLFSAYYTSVLAGPAAMISWIIGGALVIIVAFVFAELCSMIPITGSSTRIPHFTHGTLVSYIFAWLIWLSYLTLVPTEVQAMIQYLAFYYPGLLNADASLTTEGFIFATILLLFVSIINVYSVRWLVRINSFLTILKIIIPLTISFVLLYYFFSYDNVTQPANTEFSPFGMSGVFAAISSGGIVFAFNGFKVAAEMAGEAKSPKVAVPLAIVGSVVICVIVYILLQSAFLAAIPHDALSQGWQHLNIQDQFGPFATIAKVNNLMPLLILIFIGAIIGPFAAGLMYVNSAARSLYGMSNNGYLPSILMKVSPEGNPVFAIILNFFLGLLFFAPLPGWNSMATFLTSLMALTYSIAPIGLYTLRKRLPDYPRPFKLVIGRIWSVAALYACTLMVYWSGWHIVSKAGFVILAGLVILVVHYFLRFNRAKKMQWNFPQSIWLWIYFSGITLMSYLGNYGEGSLHLLTQNQIYLFGLILCILSLRIAYRVSLPAAEIKAHIEESIASQKSVDEYLEKHLKVGKLKKV